MHGSRYPGIGLGERTSMGVRTPRERESLELISVFCCIYVVSFYDDGVDPVGYPPVRAPAGGAIQTKF